MPGYDTSPTRARRLIRRGREETACRCRAGPTASTTELYVAMNTDPQSAHRAGDPAGSRPPSASRSEIKSLAQSNVIAAGGEPGPGADDLVGRYGVDRGFPRSVQLLRPDSGLRWCGVKGGWNWSWYCNKELDDQATKKADGNDRSVHRPRPSVSTEWGKIFVCSPWMRHPGFRCSTSSALRCTLQPSRRSGASIFVDPVHIPGALRLPCTPRTRNKALCNEVQPHDYTIHGAHQSLRVGSFAIPPGAETVAPGDPPFSLNAVDSSAGQLSRLTSTVENVKTLDFGKINPVTGPDLYRRCKAGRCGQGDHPSASNRRASAGPRTFPVSDCLPTSSRTPPSMYGNTITAADDALGALWPGRPKFRSNPLRAPSALLPPKPALHSIVPPRRVGGNMDMCAIVCGR